MKSLISHFDLVKDYRVVNRCSHSLKDILAIVLIAVIAGCDNFCEIVDYAEDNLGFLRSDFGLELPNGIPSEDTLERVFKRLKNSELEKCYQSFLGNLSLSGKHLAIDGKELRSTIPEGKKHALVQMVNVWVCDAGLSFRAQQVSEKSNEITAIPVLLDSMDCQGAVITIDAMGCQKAIVAKIIEKKADYLLALKENQKGLYEQVVQEFELEKAHLLSYESKDYGKTQSKNNKHGRKETRKVYVSHQLKWIDNRADWTRLETVIMVERTRIIKDETSIFKSFYITSLKDILPAKALSYVRNHWGIENGLHWQLDFTFKEDDAVLTNEVAIANLHIIRKWALLLLKKLPDKRSGVRKRKRLGRNVKLFAELFNEQC